MSCADDKTVKIWNTEEFNEEPVDTIVCKNMVMGLTCQQVNKDNNIKNCEL